MMYALRGREKSLRSVPVVMIKVAILNVPEI